MEARISLLIDFEAERDRLIQLQNNGELDDMARDDSYQDMVNRLDEHYRHKEYTDWSLDIYDVHKIMGILEKSPLIESYQNVINYLNS